MSSTKHKTRNVKHEPKCSIPMCIEKTSKLSEKVKNILSDEQDELPQSELILDSVNQDLPIILNLAFTHKDSDALLEIHKTLFHIYEASLADDPQSQIYLDKQSSWIINIRTVIEKTWLDYELLQIQPELPNHSQTIDPYFIYDWFKKTAYSNSKIDKQLLEFLKNQASEKEFKIFILSKGILNYRFSHILFQALFGVPEDAPKEIKEEIKSNLSDELGYEKKEHSHINQFEKMLTSFNLETPKHSDWGDDYRPYAGYNLNFLFALNPQNYFKSLGSLAMPELFDPHRNKFVVEGLNRVFFHNEKVNYDFYSSHIEIDEEHGLLWLQNVIFPIVKSRPYEGMELAIGALLRMKSMRLYNEYLASRFGISCSL